MVSSTLTDKSLIIITPVINSYFIQPNRSRLNETISIVSTILSCKSVALQAGTSAIRAVAVTVLDTVDKTQTAINSTSQGFIQQTQKAFNITIFEYWNILGKTPAAGLLGI